MFSAEAIGRVIHQGWRAWKVGSEHYMNHPFRWDGGSGLRPMCRKCGRGEDVHLADMVAWDRLSETSLRKFMAIGKAVGGLLGGLDGVASVIRNHQVRHESRMVTCQCGDYFNDYDAWSAHVVAEIAASLRQGTLL